MRSISTFWAITTLAAVMGCITACQSPTGSLPKKETTGAISGKAFYINSSNHSGITVTLEKTDGLRSVAALSAARDIASGARSIVARAIADTTQTAADGSYSFTNAAPGTYTIYASSPNSSERAVAINNVTLEAGRTVTAADLNLTAVGSITGRVLLDSGTTGNFGFLVSVAGTSYMAMTGDDGRFTISNVPAGSGYLIIIMKGSFTAVWAAATFSVTGGGTTTLEPNPRNFTTAEIGGSSSGESAGLAWKGELSTAPANPQVNWAYYNTADKTSYIWNGIKWDVLAAQGDQGDKGDTGAAGPQGEQGAKGDTGAPGAAGANGETPYIGTNGNWWTGATDTGVSATGNPPNVVPVPDSFLVGGKTITVLFGAGVEPDLNLFNAIKGAFTGLSLSVLGQDGFDAMIAAGLSVHISETGSLTIDVSGKKITIPVGSIGTGLGTALTTALDDEFYVAPKEGIMKRIEVPTFGGKIQDSSGNPYGIRFRFIDGIEDENVINQVLAKFEQAWTVGGLANAGGILRESVYNRVLARGLKIRIESPAASYDYWNPIDYKTIAWHIDYVLDATIGDLSMDLDYCIMNEINEMPGG